MDTKQKIAPASVLLKRAYAFYKENFKKIWLLLLLGGLGSSSLSFRIGSNDTVINFLATRGPSVIITYLAILLVLSLILFISKIALLKSIVDIRNNAYQGQFTAYKKSFGFFWSFVFLSIITPLIIFGGYALLIVPGIIISIYAVFSELRFFDTGEKGLAAITSSWKMVEGRWLEVFARLLVVTLCIFGLVLAAAIVASIIGLVLSSIIFAGSLASTKIIVSAIILLVLVIPFAVIFTIPLGILSTFEIYYDLKSIKSTEEMLNESKTSSRRKKLYLLAVIGVLAFIAIFAISAFVGYKEVSKKAVIQKAPETELITPFPILDLHKDLNLEPYVNHFSRYQINVPKGWEVASEKYNTNEFIKSNTSFKNEKYQSAVLIVDHIDLVKIIESDPGTTKADVVKTIIALDTENIKKLYEKNGYKGFQVSDPKTYTINNLEAHRVRGSAAESLEKIYDFEITVIPTDTDVYKIIALWPEAVYGWQAPEIHESFKSFIVHPLKK